VVGWVVLVLYSTRLPRLGSWYRIVRSMNSGLISLPPSLPRTTSIWPSLALPLPSSIHPSLAVICSVPSSISRVSYGHADPNHWPSIYPTRDKSTPRKGTMEGSRIGVHSSVLRLDWLVLMMPHSTIRPLAARTRLLQSVWLVGRGEIRVGDAR